MSPESMFSMCQNVLNYILDIRHFKTISIIIAIIHIHKHTTHSHYNSDKNEQREWELLIIICWFSIWNPQLTSNMIANIIIILTLICSQSGNMSVSLLIYKRYWMEYIHTQLTQQKNSLFTFLYGCIVSSMCKCKCMY